jgi:cellulose synthase/poly-beta-1,6-N-acetylglucosamine synthase-like glycosyltransferase
MGYDVIVVFTNLPLFVQEYFLGLVSWSQSPSVISILAVFSFGSIHITKNIVKLVTLAIHALKQRIARNPIISQLAYPKISVLIPAHNESCTIVDTIKSVLENSYQNKEIIVIDDHSTDDTYHLIRPFYEQGLIRIVRRIEGKVSKASAINHGSTYATGNIIMTMDGDTLLERNSLKEISKYMSDPNVVGVAGKVQVLNGDGCVNNIVTKCQLYEYTVTFELGKRSQAILKSLIILPGTFAVFRKNVFRESGMLDEDSIVEDLDLTFKLYKTGGKVMYAPKAVARTYCPGNWRAWIRQRLRWNIGNMVTLIKHRDVISSRNFAFKKIFIFALFDMLALDIFLLWFRLAVITHIVFKGFDQGLQYTFTLVIILYFITEIMAFVASSILSSRPNVLRNLYLTPFMVFIYNPLCIFVHLYSYIVVLVKKEKIEW